MPKLTLKVGEERPIATPKEFLNILSASAEFIVESPEIGILAGKTNRHFEMGNYRSVLFVNNTDAPIDIDYEIANIRTTSSGESNVNVNNEVVVKRIAEGINVNVDAVIQDGNVTIDAMPAVAVNSMPAMTVEAMPAVAVNSMPAVTIESMPAVQVQVEATVAAASAAGNPVNIVLSAGQSAEVLPLNENRHTATIVRGESDLYNIKLAYGSAVNAQNGIPFAPQATAKIQNKASVWAHNHSAFPQTIIAIDTSTL